VFDKKKILERKIVEENLMLGVEIAYEGLKC
jgi:hypothetical protein